MRRIVILPSFERSIKGLTAQEKQKLSESLKAFNIFISSAKALPGLGFKKINHDKYEFRVDIRLRVIVKRKGNDFYLVLVGSHDEVRRYLRDFR